MEDELRTIWIGSHDHAEFFSAWKSPYLRRPVSVFDTAGQAIEELARMEYDPEWIIFAQRWPGEFNSGDVRRIRQLSPLSRSVALLGSWCEGDGRSGISWADVPRIYWHQWEARFEIELDQARRGKSSSYFFPATSTTDDYLLARRELEDQGLTGKGRGLVAIWSQSRNAAEGLVEITSSHGFAAVWLPLDRPILAQRVSLVLYEADGLTMEAKTTIRQLSQRFQRVPLIAILGFPRYEEVATAQKAGATAIVSKPFLVKDLMWTVEQQIKIAAVER